MILMIDNYDSFTYNLAHAIGSIIGKESEIRIVRNDEITVGEINKLNPDSIIISPGPGYPQAAGISKGVIENFYRTIPIFGVCLGHQAICEVFGGRIIPAKRLLHGKQGNIRIKTDERLFYKLNGQIRAGRYHSLIAEESSLPQELEIIARDCENGEIMAVKHRDYPVYGVQFHPESILTPDGTQILKNFMGIEQNEEEMAVSMIGEAIKKLMNREEISFAMTKKVMDEIMDGEATEVQIASFLTALKMQGETVEHITACAEAMREHCTSFDPETDVIDIVGTGGDGAFTFNISTVSAFVVAAADIPVAKHGNRSVSSKCGAADVLEELGVELKLTPEQNKQVLKKCGMCFMFAPQYHASMKYAAPVRKQLGVRTIFNILGPLANPAGASLQLLGVYDENLVLPMAKVLANLGVKRALVVHGKDGLDEVTVCDDSLVCEIENGRFQSYLINPNDFGIKKCRTEELTGGDAKANARIAKDILNGEPGAKRDIVIMNAGVSIYLGKDGVTLEEAVRMAEETIDSGAARKKMEEFIAVTKEMYTQG